MNLSAPEVRARIAACEAAADEAFWAVVAARFPEVLSGDVEPTFVSERRAFNTSSIRYWLEGNMTPDRCVPVGDGTLGPSEDVSRAVKEHLSELKTEYPLEFDEWVGENRLWVHGGLTDNT